MTNDEKVPVGRMLVVMGAPLSSPGTWRLAFSL
jgi:hypothetical protein